MLKIWGRVDSGNVQKVTWCCAELGIPFERVDLGGKFGGLDSPEYRAMNPNMRIPTVDEDGFVLWESNSIVRHLARTHPGGGLIPDDPREHANAERWMDWNLSVMGPSFVPLVFALLRTPPDQKDPAKTETARQNAANMLAILDTHLEGREYVAGDRLSVADFATGIMTHRWFSFDIERPPAPHLEAYYQRLTARKPYQDHIMIPFS